MHKLTSDPTVATWLKFHSGEYFAPSTFFKVLSLSSLAICVSLVLRYFSDLTVEPHEIINLAIAASAFISSVISWRRLVRILIDEDGIKIEPAGLAYSVKDISNIRFLDLPHKGSRTLSLKLKAPTMSLLVGAWATGKTLRIMTLRNG